MRKRIIKSLVADMLLVLGIIVCLTYLAYWQYQFLKNRLEVSAVQNEFSFPDTKRLFYDTNGLLDDIPDVSKDDTTLLSDLQALKVLSKVTPLSIDHKGLYEQNSDYIGWIQIPDTVVSYPVYQSTDNNDYLHHNAEHKYSFAGCIFMDCRNSSTDDFNVIFHGHNMRIGTMFHSLKNYKSVGYYNTHPFVIFYPKNGGTNIYRVYSFYSDNASSLKDISYKTTFRGLSDKEDFIKNTQKMSIIDTKQHIDTDTHILTLSTCTSRGDGRYVVQAYQVDNTFLSSYLQKGE